MATDARTRMLETASRLFQRQGYHRTGFRELVGVSGAPRGSIYHHFPGGKEQIGAEAVALSGAQVRQAIDQVAATATTSSEMIRGVAAALAGWLERSGYVDGCPVATVALECAPESDVIADACRDAFRSWQRAFSEVLEQQSTPPDVAAQRARLVVAGIEGALLLARVERSPQPLLEVADEIAALLPERPGSQG